MNIISQILAVALIAAGLFVMFSSSMVGAGISGFVGVPLFAVGIFFAVLPFIRRSKGSPSN